MPAGGADLPPLFSRERLNQMSIQPLFPDLASPTLALGWGQIDKLYTTPDPEEWLDIQHAAAARQQEFVAGRNLAKVLAHFLGLPNISLRRGDDRSPRWPTDRCGSLTHCSTVCAAVVSTTEVIESIGIDLESVGRVEKKLWPTLFTARERDYLGQLEPEKANVEATVFFSAKESFYKCQYPLTQSWVGFQDVELERSDDKVLRISPTNGDKQRWHVPPIHMAPVDERHVATLILLYR